MEECMSLKKILFINAFQKHYPMFWNEMGMAKAEKYGFQIDFPAKDGDVENIDWSKLLPEYDALITTWRSPVCSAEFLKNAPKVKVIGHCAGSVVAVVNESTFTTGVKVTGANSVMAEAVAEWSLLATLLAQRNLTCYAKLDRAGRMNWAEAYNMQDIKKMTIALWGMGDTTRHLLKFLAPLKPGRILIVSNHASEAELSAYGAEKATLDEALQNADVFHCLVGVTAENFERIGAKEFAMMKDGATFVNGGRARLTRENDLVAELQTGRINAILDVFSKEPFAEDHPFNDLDNVILTPHNAGFTGRDRFLPYILDEFDRFFRGEAMLSEVSSKRFATMTNEKMR